MGKKIKELAKESSKKAVVEAKKPSKDKIIIADKIYVPYKHIDEYALVKFYEKRFYDEQMCRRCDYLPDRHSYICDTCVGFKDHVKLHNVKVINEKKYVGLPIGDKKSVERKMGLDYNDYKIIDRRKVPELDKRIKIIIKPFDYQEKLMTTFLKKGAFGFIVSPPRSGKTFLMLDIMVRLGYRAILLASQHEFLQQFLWHIEGNEAEGIPKCTNLPELQAKTEDKLYGFPKTERDYETMQIMCQTYQTFLSEKGQAKLKKLIPHIGTLAIDEADQGNAKHFSSIISKVPARYKIGATGTFSRKDCFEGKTKILVGKNKSITIKELVENSKHKHVLSINHKTGKTEIKKILERHEVEVDTLVEVMVDGVTFLCTPEHEWWSKTRNSYVKASDLRVGEDLGDFK